MWTYRHGLSMGKNRSSRVDATILRLMNFFQCLVVYMIRLGREVINIHTRLYYCLYAGGGEMIVDVFCDRSTYAGPPSRLVNSFSHL